MVVFRVLLRRWQHFSVNRKPFIFGYSCIDCNSLVSGFFTSRNMSQKSITSFFKITPKKAADLDEKNDMVKEEKERLSDINSEDVVAKTKRTKRLRIDSSSSESNSPKKQFVVENSTKKEIKVEVHESMTEMKSPESKKIKLTPKDKTKINKQKVSKSPKKTAADGTNQTTKKTPLKQEDSIKTEKSPISKENNKENLKIKIEKADDQESGNKASIVLETEYNPSKLKYHPIKDACWQTGQEVPYLALAKTLEAIENISARLKIIEILSNYFRSVIVLTPEDLLPSIYLCLNQLAPAYESLELGIAETYLMKAIGQCTGRTLAQVKSAAQKSGDLGVVAEQARATQKTMFTPKALTVRKTFAALKEIASITGNTSVNKKIAKIQSLYVACRYCEARYLIRSLEGKLRIGLAEQSVLQAIAVACTLTPPEQEGVKILDTGKGLEPDKIKAKVDEQSLIIKTTYCECPNYDMIVPVLLKHGVKSLPEHCTLTPGIPLKPMLAHPTKGVHEIFNRFENEQFTCEWKYDGERAQIHVPGKETPDFDNSSIFSRNQENNTSKYPDILRRLDGLLKDDVASCVLDCEAVAYDIEKKQILPFQILSTRKRKDATESDIKIQVCVFVFDLLYLNGQPLVREPLAKRRDLLRKHFNEVEGQWQFATSADCSNMEEVQQFLEESVKGSCEGLMVKTLNGDRARYDIARRSHNWLKLKKDYLDGVGDTIDVVVIGGYRGKGKRTGVFGGFLLACYDPSSEEYQSLCKIGTGFTEQNLEIFSKDLLPHEVEAAKSYYRFDNSHEPDVWFAPVMVWEIRCADLSLSPAHRAAIGLVDPDKGISLRFPRFIRIREDKTPENATSAQQIAEMYSSQDQVKNTTKAQTNQDDFY